jgi:lon-related putative ATP-dependent protease
MALRALKENEVYRRVDPAGFKFASTAALTDLEGVLGQDRAVEAFDFGVGIRRDGYNLFVMGAQGSGRHSTVRRYLSRLAPSEAQPDDWIYVNNFDQPHRPSALRLPAGRANGFAADMKRLVEDITAAIPATFETDEYRNRREAIENRFKERQEEAFGAIGDEAQKRGLALIRTPMGLALAPVKDNEVMPPEDFRKLPQPLREQIEKDIAELQERLQQTMQQVPDWDRERRRDVRELNREITSNSVALSIAALKQKYQDLPEILAHLDRVQQDIVENAEQFLHAEAQGQQAEMSAMMGVEQHSIPGKVALARRYDVNVVVGDQRDPGAPVVFEESPAYNNIIGRVEHLAEMGALLTDFTLIKPGSLHAANGGYLVIDALHLLQQPYAWEGLKRALRTRSIRIESVGQMLSMISTVSLEPEPIPLDVKVVLVGDRFIYYLLCRNDPDFAALFKVVVDFEDDMDHGARTRRDFARLLATLVRQYELRHLSPDGVARTMEHAIRLAGDSGKLTLRIGPIADILKEADYFAGRSDHDLIGREDVQRAIDAQIGRGDRISRRMQQSIIDETVLIDTAGAQVGQINGLAVYSLGPQSFGKPSRITARVRIGNGEIVDIERRSELGGSLHTKGVMILSAYLGARYASDEPLSLSASLVFEQSYGGVDGDSASSAELYVLLSALTGLPIDQRFAVTGSVNQHGMVQAIGGVNEKIEGFYDICHERGLTGDQGVLIPKSNVRHLMLRPDVVADIAAGRFHVYPVATIDEGIELLTGRRAGRRRKDGSYPPGTINRMVHDRLAELSEKRRKFGRPEISGSNGGSRGQTAGKPDERPKA